MTGRPSANRARRQAAFTRIDVSSVALAQKGGKKNSARDEREEGEPSREEQKTNDFLV
jgi:hypothetical protein